MIRIDINRGFAIFALLPHVGPTIGTHPSSKALGASEHPKTWPITLVRGEANLKYSLLWTILLTKILWTVLQTKIAPVKLTRLKTGIGCL